MLLEMTKEKKMVKGLVVSHLTGWEEESVEVFLFLKVQVLDCTLWKYSGDTFN